MKAVRTDSSYGVLFLHQAATKHLNSPKHSANKGSEVSSYVDSTSIRF